MLKKWSYISYDVLDDLPIIEPFSIKTSNIYITDSQQDIKQILSENVSTIKFKVEQEFDEAIEIQIMDFIDEQKPAGDVVFLLNETIGPVEKYHLERKEEKIKPNMKNLLESRKGWI
jgi:hypothetical protein